jgi:hypothetical protein
MTAINSAARGKGPKMYTIQEIVKELGHENRKDILKINCEKCECYQDWISMDIQQILVESRAPWAPMEATIGLDHQYVLPTISTLSELIITACLARK